MNESPAGPVPDSPAAPQTTPHAGPPRVLIIRLSAIGDVIHTLPVLSALRRWRPAAHIGWAVDDRAARLLEGHPLIDRLHILPVKIWKKEKWSILRRWKALREFGAELRAENYDTTLDVQGLSKSAYLGYLSGAPTRIGFGDKDGREISPVFNNRRVRPAPNRRHVVDRNLTLLEPLLATVPALTGNPREDFPLVEHRADQATIAAFWQQLGWPDSLRPFFLYPFTMWTSKVYPHELLIEVARLLIAQHGRPVVVGWGSPAEGAVAQKLVEHINAATAAASVAVTESTTAKQVRTPADSQARAAALAAQAAFAANAALPRAVLALPTTLSEQAALLDRITVAIGPDTGPLHTAVARGTPAVMLYGASDPVRNGPYGPPHIALTAGVPCHPCWKQVCPLNDTPLICLKNITPAQVAKAASDLLALEATPRAC